MAGTVPGVRHLQYVLVSGLLCWAGLGGRAQKVPVTFVMEQEDVGCFARDARTLDGSRFLIPLSVTSHRKSNQHEITLKCIAVWFEVLILSWVQLPLLRARCLLTAILMTMVLASWSADAVHVNFFSGNVLCEKMSSA